VDDLLSRTGSFKGGEQKRRTSVMMHQMNQAVVISQFDEQDDSWRRVAL
jgi:hypothetical protein